MAYSIFALLVFCALIIGLLSSIFLVKKIKKSLAIYAQPTPPIVPPSPENTLIVFDIHGVLFHHNYPSMARQFVQTNLLLKLMPCLLNKNLIAQAWRLVKTNAVPEAYMVGLAQQFSCLKPHSLTSINIANTQLPNMPVWDLVQALKEQGYTLHILSNIGETIFEDLRAKNPTIFSAFDAVNVANKTQNYIGKPHPEFFKKYLTTHNPTGKQIIFIDDKPKNIKAAQAYGMTGLFFCCPAHLHEKLQALGISS